VRRNGRMTSTATSQYGRRKIGDGLGSLAAARFRARRGRRSRASPSASRRRNPVWGLTRSSRYSGVHARPTQRTADLCLTFAPLCEWMYTPLSFFLPFPPLPFLFFSFAISPKKRNRCGTQKAFSGGGKCAYFFYPPSFLQPGKSPRKPHDPRRTPPLQIGQGPIAWMSAPNGASPSRPCATRKVQVASRTSRASNPRLLGHQGSSSPRNDLSWPADDQRLRLRRSEARASRGGGRMKALFHPLDDEEAHLDPRALILAG